MEDKIIQIITNSVGVGYVFGLSTSGKVYKMCLNVKKGCSWELLLPSPCEEREEQK